MTPTPQPSAELCQHDFRFSEIRTVTKGYGTTGQFSEEIAIATCRSCGWVRITEPSKANQANCLEGKTELSPEEEKRFYDKVFSRPTDN